MTDWSVSDRIEDIGKLYSERQPKLRDQFAMAAMNALQIPYSQTPAFGEEKSVRAGYARLCYEIADAMMKERDRNVKLD